MMISCKNLLLSGLNQNGSNFLIGMRSLWLIVLLFTAFPGFAQDKDKALQKSNNYVYEGNALIEDDFVAAEKEYRKAISKKPDNTPAPYNLGNAYYNSGHYNEALLRHVEAANLAVSKEDRHRAYHNIGNTLMKQKQCKQAVEAYKNALRNDPTDEESRYNLAIAKECAKEQGGGGGGEDDKKEEDKEEEQEQENKNDEGNDEQDKKDGDDQEDEEGKPQDEQDKKDGDPRNEKKESQPQQGKLSPQQVKSLLEAMDNQERKVQEKMNAKKVKGERVKTEKDW
jgi:tetratricopeptide (TPR) repeat protein